MSKLNLDTFNEILFGALKEQTPEIKKELLVSELRMSSDVLEKEIFDLLDELEKSNYESEQFTKIKNIRGSMEHMIAQIEELDKEIKNND